MLLADTATARAIDKGTIEDYKIPSLLLMENAGLRVADIALAEDAKSYAVVCGKGNNGGDGYVAARHIFCKGKDVCIILLAYEEEIKDDAKAMLQCAKSIGVPVFYGLCKEVLEKSEVIIDAMLGIGITGKPKEPYCDAIDYINSLDKKVIAIDIPSGVNADNGAVEGCAVKCTKTVTFGVGRTGLMLYPARDYAGKVYVEGISFAPQLFEDIKTKTLEYITIPQKGENCHKGSVGKVLFAAGSEGMTGAAYLASTSALKAGSGVVTLCIPKTFNPVMERKLTEVMTIPVSDNGKTFVKDGADEVIKQSAKYDALVVGCGIGNNPDTKTFVNKVVTDTKCPLVLDADGLNVLDKESIKNRPDTVITPHLGEMSGLTGFDISFIQSNLTRVATDFAKEYGVAVVLKCATTVVAFPDGDVYINTIGNSGMATAGSGDVLAGIIGSQLAQLDDFKTAVINGVWLHSAAGDEAEKRLGKKYMSATDIIENLMGKE